MLLRSALLRSLRRLPRQTQHIPRRLESNGPPVQKQFIRSSAWERYLQRGPISWRTVAVTFTIAAAGLAYVAQEKQAQEDRAKTREAERQNASYGKPQIGGSFELVDCESGRTVTDQDFRGKFMIMYFGFTHCPDVCPDELEKMSKAITKIDALRGIGDQVTPVFITVDPKRDTPEAVRVYIKEFHPRFVGLTGSEEQVEAVAKKFRVYISKGDVGVNGSEDDYLVDHSIFFFFMDPDGTFMDFFGRNATADDIADKVLKHVRQWQKNKDSGRLQEQ